METPNLLPRKQDWKMSGRVEYEQGIFIMKSGAKIETRHVVENSIKVDVTTKTDCLVSLDIAVSLQLNPSPVYY